MIRQLKPNERREAILIILCKRRHDTISNLAQEFGVSVRTIKYDIEELTLAHPIETIRGRYGGGVRVSDGYYADKKYLDIEQVNLLKKLYPLLSESDKKIMDSIFKDFTL